MTHEISAQHLTIERVGEIINQGMKLALSDDARNRIIRCRQYLDEKIASSPVPVYGVTTGFGSLCKVSVSQRFAYFHEMMSIKKRRLRLLLNTKLKLR